MSLRTAPIAFLAVVAAAMLAGGCSRNQWRMAEGMAWGTLYHIAYEAPCDLHDSIRATMRSVELSVSPFEPASRISAINSGQTDTLDAMLETLVATSQYVCSISGGAFDPTVMPLVDLWGFGPSGRNAVPTQQQIDSARMAVGIMDCRIESQRRLVRKHSDTRLDFSAIAKGMGVDAVAAMLRRNGAQNYMVEIGGEVAVGGLNSRGMEWRIQIDAPVESTHERMRVVNLPGGSAAATSGNYRNYREDSAGNRAGHIISPITGRPVHTATLSATVIAPSCMMADALATAAMGMRPDSALAMVAKVEGASLLLAIESGDSISLKMSPDFP